MESWLRKCAAYPHPTETFLGEWAQAVAYTEHLPVAAASAASGHIPSGDELEALYQAVSQCG